MADQIRAKTITIATAGTPTQIDSTYTFCKRVEIKPPATNTGRIYFGGSDMNTGTKRASIEVGDKFTLFGVDLTNTYVDVSVNNEKVEVIFYI